MFDAHPLHTLLGQGIYYHGKKGAPVGDSVDKWKGGEARGEGCDAGEQAWVR